MGIGTIVAGFFKRIDEWMFETYTYEKDNQMTEMITKEFAGYAFDIVNAMCA